MENEFEYGNFEQPVNVGVSSTLIDLVTSIFGRKYKESQSERNFNYNYLQGYQRKCDKWKGILKNDLLTKGQFSQSEVKSILSSNFIELYFNKYFKEIYYLYFVMGYSKDSKVEEQVFKELKPQIDKVFNELLDVIKSNASENLLKTIYGPILKSFVYDAYNDGTSYSAYITLNGLRSF
ncbi:hypothetical protein [Priestia flexa]|uniref:hypothetical protein n=1 Tax=Priestia flexa TaxID=86664 RepID=UPI001C94585A|nr:hypothetical protein [Priestia flexa]MBY6088676.1 hypothetical protein [Priestia flexa]